MTRIFKKLLADRGLDDNFLHPKYENLFDPFLMLDIAKAVDRIEQARDGGEKVIIYGDYDADGVTASTVCRSALEYFGCKDIEVMLPDRFRDGYGLNMPVIPEIVQREAKLVITVDCGSGSGDVISALRERGIDVIVTDHHEIPSVPKDALAVINPHRKGEKYGKNMAGVGVAFTLARALNMRKNGGACDGQEKWLLDLVALGTICDSMILREENRIMTYYGMLVLTKTRRRGLQELAKVAKCKLDQISTHAIGFQLGPRINAAGRMKSANIALDLMTTESRAEATRLALELDALNTERKTAQDKAVKEVADQLDDAPVIIAHGKWHEGIVGIVAGRLSEIYRRPAFALTQLEDGTYKGSGRSFGDFSLAEALHEGLAGTLLTGGGHAGACGLSFASDKMDEFKEKIVNYYLSLDLKDQERYLRVKSDVELKDLSELTVELYDEICSLEPFGVGNEEPVFEFIGIVEGKRILKEKHLSLTISDGENEIRMMSFYASDEQFKVETGDNVKVQFTLSKNEWGGKVSIEGMINSLEVINKI
ncbi:MAG: single-stranded-DNA-specific exonuclease RecJ [Candidatus Saccharibacteria bacterium]|nr:single-stranded-DNA-specific exonuclease RecJ [Candidatus Saccharibacteria bacterium]